MFSTSSVASIFTTFLSGIGQILTDNLGAVLLISAGLIGLGILIYYVRRWIGRK